MMMFETAHTTSAGGRNKSSPVYLTLYKKYYQHGKVLPDATASSHWIECARKFKAMPPADCRQKAAPFELQGYGFGSSHQKDLISFLFTWLSTQLHLRVLRMPGLRDDVKKTAALAHRMGLTFSQDAFRQACTLNLLSRSMIDEAEPKLILVIGDGHGILSALLHDRYPGARLYLVDLGSVLFFQSLHLHIAFPEALQALTPDRDCVNAVFNFCPADALTSFPDVTLDLAVNIASMQEMTSDVINRYFDLLRKRNTGLFYCCNRLEKRLIGGEISRFTEYPWSDNDVHMLDEPCPWHEWFVGRGTSPNLKVWGIPLPLMHCYDGRHHHRLTQLRRTP